MAHELYLGGEMYISSKRASEVTGYKRDYIGQLARGGKIIARRIGGLWYVLEESLHGHKAVAGSYVPTPPHLLPGVKETNQPDSLVSFDGRKYVSSAEAARLTSYHPDYIGQLARSEKILSRQVGNRWFIDLEGLTTHKAEKDRLLAEVQVESVGLLRSIPKAESPTDTRPSTPIHFTYTADTSDLLPNLGQSQDLFGTDAVAESAQRIPIRIIHTPHEVEDIVETRSGISSRRPGLSIFYGSFTAIVTIVIVIAFNINIPNVIPVYTYSESSVLRNSALAGLFDAGLQKLTAITENRLSTTIYYERKK